jgi:hypothetical protein
MRNLIPFKSFLTTNLKAEVHIKVLSLSDHGNCPPSMPSFTVGPHTFKTKSELQAFEKTTMESLPLTESLKHSASSEIFDFYYAFVHRHPDAPRKLAGGIADFKIVPSERNPATKELQIIHPDGTCSSISRITCVTQRGETNHALLRGAMRTAIEDQIRTYRDCHGFCEMCNAVADDIDHILPFAQLMQQFCDGRTDIPISFSKRSGTNQHCFKECNNAFETEWQSYHRANASLRALCKSCHTSRSSWDHSI